MAAQDSVNTAAMYANTPPAPMDEEPSQDNEDGTWFLVARKRKKQAQAESNLAHNTEPTQQGQTQPMFRKKSSLLPPLPIGDLKVVFRPRDGLNLGEWPQHSIARAIGMAAQFTDATLHQLTIRIRREQNVAVVSTPDDDLAARLQQIKVLSCKQAVRGSGIRGCTGCLLQRSNFWHRKEDFPHNTDDTPQIPDGTDSPCKNDGRFSDGHYNIFRHSGSPLYLLLRS
ncbi:hypothetical protein HPB50_014446 [Hyalomma asiaticum]|uniref:Uncharacterized protein n=1 Tax=Hyalomma asiaticum TaxID=266040 RepID=A0ACB7RWQ5_HYAAI|nr:hypothetical protein HPB50_014446 [Hyalomma asiaticum]